MKATIAVLGFILSSAAKHNVDSESLSSELQQLGLPKGGGPLGCHHRLDPLECAGAVLADPSTAFFMPSAGWQPSGPRSPPLHAIHPWGLFWVSYWVSVAATPARMGGFVVLSVPLCRARQRVVPLLRGEAELPPGQPQGLQPKT